MSLDMKRKICFISMNLAGYPCKFSLSQTTINKLNNALSGCTMVIVGTQESSSETSFVDVLEKDVLTPRSFYRQRTIKKKIQSSFVQHLMRAATIIAENATWMFCAYKTPHIYCYTYQHEHAPTGLEQDLQQYKCLRPCGFTIESGNIWKGANFLKINFGNNTLFVVNTHLFYTSHAEDHGLALRKEQFKKIIELIVRMCNQDTIIVFMGDLNFRMNYPTYNADDGAYQQFIQQHAKKLTRQNDELYTFLGQEKDKAIPLQSQSQSSYKRIIQGLLNDIPEKLPLTCKRKSQQQQQQKKDKKPQDKPFQEEFQIRTDKKKNTAPLPSKERKPSNCDKILIHGTYGVSSSPIGTFKVKNTDHCGVYRTLSI